MVILAAVVTALMACVTTVLGLPQVGASAVDIRDASTTELPVSFTEFTMKWTGSLSDAGANVSFSGTAKEIHDQILAANPDYKFDYPQQDLPPPSAKDRRSVEIHCGIGGDGPAMNYAIDDGIWYLYALKGECGADPGPAACGRVSCSYDSGIWWCNDAPRHVSCYCRNLAQDAQNAYLGCRDTTRGTVQGQAFAPGGSYNVLVGHARC